jgi:hypothetical protein
MSCLIILDSLPSHTDSHEYVLFLENQTAICEVFTKIMKYPLFKKNKKFLNWMNSFEKKYSIDKYSIIDKFLCFQFIVNHMYDMTFKDNENKIPFEIQDDVEELDILMGFSIHLLYIFSPNHKHIKYS